MILCLASIFFIEQIRQTSIPWLLIITRHDQGVLTMIERRDATEQQLNIFKTRLTKLLITGHSLHATVTLLNHGGDHFTAILSLPIKFGFGTHTIPQTTPKDRVFDTKLIKKLRQLFGLTERVGHISYIHVAAQRRTIPGAVQ